MNGLDRLIGPAEPELGCDECFDLLDAYVELELAGISASTAMPAMRAHLSGCPVCREDHDSLLALLRADPADGERRNSNLGCGDAVRRRDCGQDRGQDHRRNHRQDHRRNHRLEDMGVMYEPGRIAAVMLLGHHLSLGGGGLAHFLIRLFIWHEIWRLFRYLWRIPTFGPFIVIALGLAVVGLVVWRQYRRPAWAGRRRRGGSTGFGAGGGPRDW